VNLSATITWIKVEDSLPTKHVEVLIAFDETDLISTGQLTSNRHDARFREGWSYSDENMVDGKWPTVTHWSYAPPHPKEMA